jgi:hypothetical protein
MRDHKNCNVLGEYCWTCRVKTSSHIPGWTRPMRGPYTHYSPWASNNGKGVTEAVIWANGDIESKREGTACTMCGKNCSHPVNRSVTERGDNYREITYIPQT